MGVRDDILRGEPGNDTLDGGLGNDKMAGGLGNDTFIFSAERDRIMDFNAANNREKVDPGGVASIRHFQDLKNNHTAKAGGNVVIDDGAGYPDPGGLGIGDLGKGDFIF